MKELKIILVVLLIFLPIWAVHRYITEMTPVWQITAAQQAAIDLQQRQADAQTDVQAHRERVQWWTSTLESTSGIALLLIAGAGVMILWVQYDKRRESWARPVDGQYALQQRGAFMLDPNKSVFGVFGVDPKTGNLISDANMIGPDRQLAYAAEVQRTRTAAAVTGGDGFRFAATGKFLAGAYDRQQRAVDYAQDAPAALPDSWQPLTVQDAFNQSDRFRWIIGQNQKTGELCTINPKENSHFGIVGSNGTGKTAYVALLLMAYALKYHFRVIVLDGKGGADWSRFRNMVEYYALDYSNVGELVDQLYSEYERRQAILNEYQANSIWELPKGAAVPRPTLIIVDEFGAVMDSLKAADKMRYKRFELQIGNLLRLSRGAGLYIVPCDQNPTKWPGTVRANMPINVCFRLGGNIGNAINEYNLDHLDRVGHFKVAGVDYHAWPTYQEIDSLLANVDYKKPKALLDVQRELQQSPTKTSPTIDDQSIGDRGEGEEQNPTHTHYRPTIDTPENYRQPIDEPSIVQPLLTGKPLSPKDRALVWKVYAETKDYKKTCEILWGKWNPGRDKWLKDVLAENEGRQ